MEDLSIAPVPFWYLRHGQTDWNVQGLSQGNVDIPLNETGLEQAKQAAVKMRHRGIVSIVSSPLSRARVTAEIVAEALGVDVILEPDLREVSWGVQEGKPLAEWFQPWISGQEIPEGAESFSQLRRRTVNGLNRAVGLPPVVLVVAHGGVFRALRSAMNIDFHGRTRNCVPIWCEPHPEAHGKWTVAVHDE